jgi:hypothetical protein
MIAQKTKIVPEVKMEIIYFVSPNGSVDANEILQQYITDQDRRRSMKTAIGESVDVYQIKRDLINKIRANRNLKYVVKFYTQYLEDPLKEMVFPTRKVVAKRSEKFLRSKF